MAPPHHLFQDWAANEGNIKGRLVMVAFRSMHWLRLSSITFVLFLPLFVFYRVLVEWIMCIELPWKTRVGPGLRLHHGQGLVVNDRAVLGAECTLRNSTTIGSRQKADGQHGGSPIIGDRVDIGANAVIIGEIRIGDDATIGAGAVVVKDVPPRHVAVGNPARIFARDNQGTNSRAKAATVGK